MSIELSAANFEQESQVAGPVIVDFWAPWCNPCRMLAPVLEELAKDKPEVKVCKVNIDEEQALAERFGVMSIPTVVCLRDGVEKSRSVGLMRKGAFFQAGNNRRRLWHAVNACSHCWCPFPKGKWLLNLPGAV